MAQEAAKAVETGSLLAWGTGDGGKADCGGDGGLQGLLH